MATLTSPLEHLNATHVRVDKRKLLYFGGCDYFRLSWNSKVRKALAEAVYDALSLPSTIAGIQRAATATPFSGGDVSEGLDLDGDFTYAINVGGPALGAIRDANFTADNVAGFSITATDANSSFFAPDYGSTTNDNRLETLMQSIRYSVVQSPVMINVGNLVVGDAYKVQFLV